MSTVSEPSRRWPLVFVDDLVAPVLAAPDERHLRKSLRMQTGDPVTVADGRGAHRRARLGPEGEVIVAGEVEHEAEPSRRLGVAFAPVKAQKPEWVAAKLTELGLDDIRLVIAERSVVRWDAARAGKAVERMTIAVREAAMQCRRARLPEVHGVVALAALPTLHAGGSAPVHLALAEPDEAPPAPEIDTIVVGPEGGWSPEEVSAAPALVGLPGRILRAETAAIVAGTLLAAGRRH
ncbi:MAG: RsmE family RNA methyltransferase [Acidimicrobiales bacterium]